MIIKALEFTKIIFGLFIICFIFSCSQKKALIINCGLSKNHPFCNSKKRNFPNKNYLDKSEIEVSKFVTVKRGENIYTLAKKYDTSVHDLIAKNNLKPPYFLKVGTKINLPDNQYYQVLDGDTLYSISRKYGMNINILIATNNLQKPYSIKIGQKLKVSQSNIANISINNSVAYDEKDNNFEKKSKVKNLPEAKIVDKNNNFIWPLKGLVISKFGPKSGGLYNDGINIKSTKESDVKASEDGVVAYAGNELRGYGNLIIIKHSKGWISAYGHLDRTRVKRGDLVKKGQNIANVGSTGNVKFPQLYFGLRNGREAVNPQKYLYL